MRQPVRLGDVGADRDPARVGVLDDGHCRFTVVVGGALGGIGVDEVVVGHLLAMELLCRGDSGAPVGVERRLLVRVLAIAKDLRPCPGRAHPRGKPGAVTGVREDAAHPTGDGEVVARRVHKRLRRKGLALTQSETAAAHGNQHRAVFGGVGHYRDTCVVLGRGSHHRGSTDVDLLDALLLGCT